MKKLNLVAAIVAFLIATSPSLASTEMLQNEKVNVNTFSHNCEVFLSVSYTCGLEDYYFDKRNNDMYRVFYSNPSSFDEDYE